jgi:putative heme-binding domain-containing protein
MFRLAVAFLAGVAWAQTNEKMPVLTPGDLENGGRLYNGQCSGCHGPKGDGGKGANLARPKLPRAPDDAALFRVIQSGVPGGEMPGAWAMTDREVWMVAAFVKTLGRVQLQTAPGDAAKGEQVYTGKGGCVACHALKNGGGRLGPELNQIGMRRSLAHLRESLVNPGADVPDGFAWVELIDKKGTKVEGVRLNEDTFSIQVRDTKDGLRSYWKHDLKQFKVDLKKSPMPSYAKSLSDSELTDVVAYLASLGGGQ